MKLGTKGHLISALKELCTGDVASDVRTPALAKKIDGLLHFWSQADVAPTPRGTRQLAVMALDLLKEIGKMNPFLPTDKRNKSFLTILRRIESDLGPEADKSPVRAALFIKQN